jgi:hypothetical protein
VLEYNASNTQRTVLFAGLSKKTPRGEIFNNTMVLEPWRA